VVVVTLASGSATLVALIQTAISVPGLVLAMFAGAVADVVNRRRMLVAASLAMAVAMMALAGLTVADVATPAIVLVLTAALGAGLAMFMPAFTATVPDLVPRPLLAPAMTITNVSVNLARAAGPAMAGGVIAIAGAGGLFWVLAGVLIAVVGTLAVFGPPAAAPEHPERIAEAVRAGARYAWFSAPLRAVILRTALFVLFGSAMWALLPLVAVRRLDMPASGFGILLGCLGAGAVCIAAVLPRMEARLGLDAIVGAGSVVVAAAIAALTVVTSPVAAGLVLFVAGAAWISALTGVITSTQVVVPAWVRGRALAAWVLAYQGGFAVGGILWGFFADASLRVALLVAAAALVASVLAARVVRLPDLHGAELQPVRSWEDPFVVAEVDDEDGPVLVTVEYEVRDGDAQAFVAAMLDLSEIRRRDGALRWELYQDVADPTRFVETFASPTWGAHMRQHERVTQVDLPYEERVIELTQGYTVHHLVSALRRSR